MLPQNPEPFIVREEEQVELEAYGHRRYTGLTLTGMFRIINVQNVDGPRNCGCSARSTFPLEATHSRSFEASRPGHPRFPLSPPIIAHGGGPHLTPPSS